MKKVNVYEAKTHLSALLDEVADGETVLICRRNVPVAQIRAVPRLRQTRRPIGLARGFTVPRSFFRALPDDWIDAFEGR